MFRRREGRGSDSNNETRFVTNLTNRTITFGDIDNLVLLPRRSLDLLKVASLQRIGSSVDLKKAVNEGWVKLKDRNQNTVSNNDICDAIIPAMLKDAQEEELVRKVKTVSSSYAVEDELDDIILVNSTATITLPAAEGLEGHHIIVKNITSGATVTIDSEDGTIDGEESQIITDQYNSLTFVSNGENWFIV